MMDPRRKRVLRAGVSARGPVVYWMSRDQRVRDNWALLHAGEIALEERRPLGVVFVLSPRFLGATLRQYDFMLRGLEEVERALAGFRIPFFLLVGAPEREIPSFVSGHRVGVLVTDFSPLRISRRWKEAVAGRLSVPFYEVDAHNVVPCWIASDKREFAAATIRPKIHRLLPTFLDEYPEPSGSLVPWKARRTEWKRVRRSLRVDGKVPPVDGVVPGEAAAGECLRRFLRERLHGYGTGRNNPAEPGQSGLSPYLHFGQISPQRVALEVMKRGRDERAQEAVLEELVVRRELAENFCLYTPGYDSVAAFPAWAKATLDRHGSDRRPYTYTRAQFEHGATHDPLWNAAQREMVRTGAMHGYMRMYWAKKILEWTPVPEQAMRIAIYLNDRYSLDGRDPNGYAGIAWSIGGVHDRAWGERPVFGKVRYMSYEGCRRKFSVERYVSRIQRLSDEQVVPGSAIAGSRQ